MPTSDDGTNTCDVCAADIGSAGIDRCATLTYQADDGRIYNLRLCTATRDGAPAGCAGNRITAQSFPEAGDLAKPRAYVPPPPPIVVEDAAPPADPPTPLVTSEPEKAPAKAARKGKK